MLPLLVLNLVGPGTLQASADAWADAALAFHVHWPSTKNQCTTNAPSYDCSGLVATAVSGPSGFYHVYVVVALRYPATGIAGVDFDIKYDSVSRTGVDVLGWHLCADGEFPRDNWPASGGSNRITWDLPDNCQRTEVGSHGAQAIAGWFYVAAYSQGYLTSVRETGAPYFTVVDCDGVAREVWPCLWGGPGIVRFSPSGEWPGCNPCVQACFLCTPIAPTTWGRIKARLGSAAGENPPGTPGDRSPPVPPSKR